MQPDFPFPETLPALANQVRMLRAGAKPMMLVPYGLPPGIMLPGLHTLRTSIGLAVATDPAEFIAIPSAMEDGRLGRLLGYGIDDKPPQPDRSVSVIDAQGMEILTVMADAETELEVEAALQSLTIDPTWMVARTDPVEVLTARAAWWLHFFRNLQTAKVETT